MRYWLLFGLLVSCGRAQAQAPAGPVGGRGAPVQFGLKVGFAYSTADFNQGVPRPVVPVENRWQPGFVVGALLVVPLRGRLAVQQEYLYAQLGGAVAGGPRYTLRYLSLPLLLSYRVLPRTRLLLGPQFDLLIQAQQELSGQATDLTHDTEERALGATAGLDVQLGAHLHLGARFVQGLNHVGIGQRPAAQEFKWEVVQLGADYRW